MVRFEALTVPTTLGRGVTALAARANDMALVSCAMRCNADDVAARCRDDIFYPLLRFIGTFVRAPTTRVDRRAAPTRMASAIRGCAICPRLKLRAHRRSRLKPPVTRCMSGSSEANASTEKAAAAVDANGYTNHPVHYGKRYHGANLMMQDSVFAELSLAEASQKVAGVRVRQHVNPLKASLQTQAPVPEWRSVFADSKKPLLVDIGCGGGRFDLMFGKRNPEMNVLGVDIRAPLVERGNAWGTVAGIVDNVHFAECNATVSIGAWLKSYAEERDDKNAPAVSMVAIQFPDPHFKKRHHKRRVVQAALVRAVAQGLEPGARVFLQSDVKEVSEDMREKFEKFGAHLFELDQELHNVSAIAKISLETNKAYAASAAAEAFLSDEKARVAREKAEANGYPGRTFKSDVKNESEDETNETDFAGDEEGTEVSDHDDAADPEAFWQSAWSMAGDREGWLDENPLDVPTERECQTNDSGGLCYRVMLVRNDVPVADRA